MTEEAARARWAAVLLDELRRHGITATVERDVVTGERWLRLRGPLHAGLTEALRPYIPDLLEVVSQPWLTPADGHQG